MSRDGESYLVNMRGRFLNLTEIPSFILKRFWMWADFKVPSQVHELYPPAAGVLRAPPPSLLPFVLAAARPHCPPPAFPAASRCWPQHVCRRRHFCPR